MENLPCTIRFTSFSPLFHALVDKHAIETKKIKITFILQLSNHLVKTYYLKIPLTNACMKSFALSSLYIKIDNGTLKLYIIKQNKIIFMFIKIHKKNQLNFKCQYTNNRIPIMLSLVGVQVPQLPQHHMEVMFWRLLYCCDSE